MKYSYLFFISLLTTSNSEKMIKNILLPSCKNCIHYQPSIINLDYTASYNTCGKFGRKNIITDKIIYDYAESCRKDKDQCGEEGKYFEKDENLVLKMAVHRVASLSPYFLLVFFSLLPAILVAL